MAKEDYAEFKHGKVLDVTRSCRNLEDFAKLIVSISNRKDDLHLSMKRRPFNKAIFDFLFPIAYTNTKLWTKTDRDKWYTEGTILWDKEAITLGYLRQSRLRSLHLLIFDGQF